MLRDELHVVAALAVSLEFTRIDGSLERTLQIANQA
jgi:hypothetical protein